MKRSLLYLAVTLGILGAALGSIGWVCASGGQESAQRPTQPWDDSGADAYRHCRMGRSSTLHFLLRDTTSTLR
jgi:hypothetical protein